MATRRVCRHSNNVLYEYTRKMGRGWSGVRGCWAPSTKLQVRIITLTPMLTNQYTVDRHITCTFVVLYCPTCFFLPSWTDFKNNIRSMVLIFVLQNNCTYSHIHFITELVNGSDSCSVFPILGHRNDIFVCKTIICP